MHFNLETLDPVPTPEFTTVNSATHTMTPNPRASLWNRNLQDYPYHGEQWHRQDIVRVSRALAHHRNADADS